MKYLKSTSACTFVMISESGDGWLISSEEKIGLKISMKFN